jgi:transposase
MTYILGHDRSQILLLPEAVDDYVGPDNPVRFIDAFVDGLDLSTASFSRVEPKVTGRPGYAPADLLKLYIYGYLNPGAVESSAGGRDPPQYRGDLVAATPEAGLQDNR